jgi:cytidine deaminase
MEVTVTCLPSTLKARAKSKGNLGIPANCNGYELAKQANWGHLRRMIEFTSLMDIALVEARKAQNRGEVPVGAVIVSPDGNVIAQAGNRTRELNDPTGHAEILAIRAACAELGQERLAGCDLYVTLEPCPMCAAAISNARIARLYYGAADPKSGGVAQGPRVFSHPQCHHVPEVYDGISEAECSELLVDFFAGLREG